VRARFCPTEPDCFRDDAPPRIGYGNDNRSAWTAIRYWYQKHGFVSDGVLLSEWLRRHPCLDADGSGGRGRRNENGVRSPFL